MTRLGRLRSALVGVVLSTLAGGCATGPRPAAEEGTARSRVTLVSRVAFLPPSWMDASGFGRVRLGFSYGPDAKVSPDRVLDEDLSFVVPKDEPFVVVTKRRPLYLRSVTVAFKRQSTSVGYNQINAWFVKCLDDRAVPIADDDEVVYLGLLTCAYERPDEIRVRDEWGSVSAKVSKQVDVRKVRVVLPLPRVEGSAP